MVVTIITFVVILGLIVFVHELGHFLAARRMGAAVEEFGFGLPPKIIGIKKKDTLYSLNWIPVGGFVKIKGEDGADPNDQKSFASKKVWQRIFMLSAGVTMNVVLAMVLFSIGFGVGLPSTLGDNMGTAKIRDQKVQIIEVAKNTPAEKAGLVSGDQIVKIDNVTITTVDQVQNYNRDKVGSAETLTYKHLNKEKAVTITLENRDATGEGKMGATLVETGIISYPWYDAIWRGVKTTFEIIWVILVAFYQLIRNWLTGQPTGADVSGPIGIAVLTGQVAQLGFAYLIQFTALLSLNLAIINFIPFPALDGGRVLFVVIEKIRGKQINRRVEAMIHNVGFTVLMLLIVLITLRDLNRFKDNIFGFIKNIFG